MRILRTIAETRTACRRIRSENHSLGLVPTMGALHDGHLSLVRTARTQADVVAASVFVNPTQFGPHEDFSLYPRPFEQDCALLEAEGVEFLFAPAPEEMYPAASAGLGNTFVEVPDLSVKLEGRSRPGHFRGVATVVSKLFHILQPDLAFFGQKDAQQVAVLRRMVRDLNLPVEIVVCPIVRERDGLAMSSRNAYLEPAQRRAATVLFRALTQVRKLAAAGEHDAVKLAKIGAQTIGEEALARLDYLEVVHPDTLDPLETICPGALVLVAATVGKTRLIDNVIL